MDWDEMARPWLEAAPDLEIAFTEIFAELFCSANLKPGELVLDVGCGTGHTLVRAAEAVGPSGRITGIDIAPPLISRAAVRVPENVELIVANAGDHDYAPESYDALIANFGIMFFDDTVSAFRNLRKAVRPGGRMAATVWGPPGDNPWFAIPRRIVDDIVADVPRPDPAGPGPMRFGEPSGLLADLETAGWRPDIRSVDLHLCPPGRAEQVADLHMKVTVGMMLRGMDVSDADMVLIWKALVAAHQDYMTDGAVRVPAKVHVVTAIAP